MRLKVGGRWLYLEDRTPLQKAVGALRIARRKVTDHEIRRVASIYNLNVQTLKRRYHEGIEE